MAFLSAESLEFGNGQTVDIGVGKGLAYFIQFERFDNRGYFFHANSGDGKNGMFCQMGKPASF